MLKLLRKSLGRPRIVLGALVLLAGCDTSVQPIDPSDDYHYSIFGILNPAQDTQWVRVEPLGAQTLQGSPQSLNVSAILRRTDTGQTWTLRDSVAEVISGHVQHNFWTPTSVAPETTYELVVANDEGDTTRARTTTPTAPPSVRISGAIRLPCLEGCPEVNTFEVRTRTDEPLAGLTVRYFQTFQERLSYDFDWYDETTKRDSLYVTVVNYLENLRATNTTLGRTCIADSADVITATGGPDWPAWTTYHGATVSEIARPDSFSNVRGGHGLLAGVYTDTTHVATKSRQPPVQCRSF